MFDESLAVFYRVCKKACAGASAITFVSCCTLDEDISPGCTIAAFIVATSVVHKGRPCLQLYFTWVLVCCYVSWPCGKKGNFRTCCVVLKWMAKFGVDCCNKIAEGTWGRHSFHRCRVGSVLTSISCLDVWAMSAPYVLRRRFLLALCAYRKYMVCPVVMNNTEMITKMPKCCGCGAEITMMKWSRSIR